LDDIIELIKSYLKKFTYEFFEHFAIVITNWENNAKARLRRKKKGITNESVKDQVN